MFGESSSIFKNNMQWGCALWRRGEVMPQKFIDEYSMKCAGYPFDYGESLDYLIDNSKITNKSGYTHVYRGSMVTDRGQGFLNLILTRSYRFLSDVSLQIYGVWEIMDSKITHRNRITERNIRDCTEMILYRMCKQNNKTIWMSDRSWMDAVQAKTGRRPGVNTLRTTMAYMVDSGYFFIHMNNQGNRRGANAFTVITDGVSPLVDPVDMHSWLGGHGSTLELVEENEQVRHEINEKHIEDWKARSGK